jgi:hypothetical protein
MHQQRNGDSLELGETGKWAGHGEYAGWQFLFLEKHSVYFNGYWGNIQAVVWPGAPNLTL